MRGHYVHVAFKVLRPRGSCDHLLNRALALPNQVLHEPIGDAEFGLLLMREHGRRQPRRLQIEIYDQYSLASAHQVPRENGGGRAASNTTFDREQRVAHRRPLRV